ncbi:MAG: hypothetical protein AAFY57_07130 [Cyanobacteria bacterium J06642_2]
MARLKFKRYVSASVCAGIACISQACTSAESVGSLAPSRSNVSTLESSDSSSSVSALFENNPRAVTSVDIALALAVLNLPSNLQANDAAIIAAASQILGTTIDRQRVNPDPSAASVNFVDPTAIEIADPALLLASSRLSQEERTLDNLAIQVNKILGANNAIDREKIVAIPGGISESIVVSGNCTLVAAINAANLDTEVQGCPAGNGPDTIELRSDVTLTDVDNTLIGPSGLPVIASQITISGNGEIIRRDDNAPEFRILLVDDDARLTLRNVVISNGFLGGDRVELDTTGGGVLSRGGTVIIEQGARVVGNRALRGGGVYAQAGIDDTPEVVIRDPNTKVENNTARAFGGGVYVVNGRLEISSGAEIIANVAETAGGIYFIGNEMFITGDSTRIARNEATLDGGGIGIQDGLANISDGVVVANNNAARFGGGMLVNFTSARLGDVGFFSENEVNFSGNTAVSGGAIFFDSRGRGDLNIVNTRFLNNRLGVSNDDTIVPTGSAIFTVSSDFSLNSSCIVNNDGVALANVSSSLIDATDNWWGAATGPGPDVGAGDLVDGNSNVGGFLRMPILGCPARN